MEEVRLRCVKEGGKLRVKIISNGFSHSANCQFPKNIREENREYIVPREDVKFAETRGKFFYRIGKKNIRIANDRVEINNKANIKDLKVYRDEESTDCAICMGENLELVILYPCGHAYTCKGCASQCKLCPICRTQIQQIVTQDQLQ